MKYASTYKLVPFSSLPGKSQEFNQEFKFVEGNQFVIYLLPSEKFKIFYADLWGDKNQEERDFLKNLKVDTKNKEIISNNGIYKIIDIMDAVRDNEIRDDLIRTANDGMDGKDIIELTEFGTKMTKESRGEERDLSYLQEPINPGNYAFQEGKGGKRNTIIKMRRFTPKKYTKGPWSSRVRASRRAPNLRRRRPRRSRRDW